MTANEQADRLLFLLNRANAGAAFSYTDSQLSQALNHAQWHYIKRFIGRSKNIQNEAFEETEIRGQGLGPLIKQEVNLDEVPSSSMYPNSEWYKLPEDFMWAIDEYFQFNTTDCDDLMSAEVRVMRHDEYSKLINNIYKKPRVTGVSALVWRMYYNSDDIDFTTGTVDPNGTVDTDKSLSEQAGSPRRVHEFILPEGFASTRYSLRYLKLPLNIIVDKANTANQVNCELAPQTHVTIVEMARDILLDAFKEQKIQSIGNLADVE